MIPLKEIFEVALGLAKAARDYIGSGGSTKVSRAVQKATRQALREGGKLSASDFAIAKRLAAVYSVQELERFFDKWNKCHCEESAPGEPEQMRAARLRGCCCDLLRALKDNNDGKLPRILRHSWQRYQC